MADDVTATLRDEVAGRIEEVPPAPTTCADLLQRIAEEADITLVDNGSAPPTLVFDYSWVTLTSEELALWREICGLWPPNTGGSHATS